MLAVPVNSFRFQYHNYGAASATPGTSVIPGASNVEGDWTEIAAAASITQDIVYLSLLVNSGFTSAQIKDHLLDIGWDPAGGTAYVEKIANIVCGESNSGISGPTFHFPCYIPAGSSIAVRVQGSNATAGTVLVAPRFFGQPTRPEMWRSAQHFETIGTITNSQGVALSATTTTWTSLGTTTRPLWWWQLAIQNSTSAAGNTALFLDMAYGDASNKHMIIENMLVNTTSSEAIYYSNLFHWPYCPVPAGSTIYVRGSNATAFNAVAIGAGG